MTRGHDYDTFQMKSAQRVDFSIDASNSTPRGDDYFLGRMFFDARNRRGMVGTTQTPIASIANTK